MTPSNFLSFPCGNLGFYNGEKVRGLKKGYFGGNISQNELIIYSKYMNSKKFGDMFSNFSRISQYFIEENKI